MENQDQEATNWSRVHLLAFRFAFVYLVLYNLPFPLGAFPRTGSLAQKYQLLWHKLVPWVGKHVLHLRHEIMASNNCSGDTTYDYVRVLCFFGFAFTATVLWSFLDRSHTNYQRLNQWLRLYLRLSVGAAMLLFGAGKIFRLQFPEPNLYKLLEPLGDSTPMGLLWTFMGASRGYSLFAGCMQMFGGLLLFVPRLTTLGALIGLAVFSNIFALNLSYDVPIKLYSLHLLRCQRLVLSFSGKSFSILLLPVIPKRGGHAQDKFKLKRSFWRDCCLTLNDFIDRLGWPSSSFCQLGLRHTPSGQHFQESFPRWRDAIGQILVFQNVTHACPSPL